MESRIGGSAMSVRRASPRFAFATARDAAYRLLAAARAARAEELHPLPFNRYDPDDTYWWLSPSTENPAYRFGKIGLTARAIVPPGRLFVGLVVEKGVGESAAPMFAETARGRRWIMDSTWRWNRQLMPALLSAELADDAAAAAEVAGVPLTVIIDAAYMTSPSSIPGDDPRNSGIPFDVVRMRYADGFLTPEEASLPGDLLTDMTSVDSFFGLGVAIEGIDRLDWAWMDFHIGLLFDSAEDAEANAWSAQEVWRRACEPWMPWVR